MHNGILLSRRKEWHSVICSNRDGPRDYHTQWSKPDRERRIAYDIHTQWSKPDRERRISYDIVYMWSLKKNTVEPVYKTETDLQT